MPTLEVVKKIRSSRSFLAAYHIQDKPGLQRACFKHPHTHAPMHMGSENLPKNARSTKIWRVVRKGLSPLYF